MIVILPFEKDFYARYNVEVDYVGHPLLDATPSREECLPAEKFKQVHKLDERPIVALLPGSRKQEISAMLKVMLEMVPLFDQYCVQAQPGAHLDLDCVLRAALGAHLTAKFEGKGRLVEGEYFHDRPPVQLLHPQHIKPAQSGGRRSAKGESAVS